MKQASFQENLQHLRTSIENTIGHKIVLPKDFVLLSEDIFERTHQSVAVNTLKRIWGNIDEHVQPRLTTLTILARYTGAESWDAFCEQTATTDIAETIPTTGGKQTTQSEQAVEEQPETDVPNLQKPEGTSHRTLVICLIVVVIILACVVVGGSFHACSYRMRINELHDSLQAIRDDKYILHCGQTFSSFDEYLHLFGIMAKDTQWYQLVPHHEGIILWGPQYHHPEWHNEGNPDSLMPTITEYWEPAKGDHSPEARALIDKMNNEGYYIALHMNEVRITFMRGLSDSTFTFLGVYRMSLDKSDTTRIVWERMADECDLQNLDELVKYRN